MKSFCNSYVRLIGLMFCSFVLFVSTIDIKGENITYLADIPWENGDVCEVTMENGKSYTKINFPNSIQNVHPGTPDIPYMEFDFLVPDGAGNFQVSVRPIEIHDSVVYNYPLMAAQISWSVNDLTNKPFLDVDSDLYRSDNRESHGVILDEIYVDSQYHVIRVGVPTMTYTPISHMARLFSKVEINLQYDNGVNPDLALVQNSKTTDYSQLEEMVVNCPIRPKAKVLAASGSLNIISPEWYYIVTPKALLSSALQIGEWKKQKGYEIKVMTVEDILSSSATKVNGISIVDEADAVRTWLISERKWDVFISYYLGIHGFQVP